MRSIRRSIALLSFVSIVLFALVLGAVSVTTLVAKTDEDASLAMNLTCANEADKIDMLLEGIEDSVETEAMFMGSRLQELGIGSADGKSLEVDEAGELLSSVAGHMEGAVSYYLRLKDADEKVSGFFYARDPKTNTFREMPLGMLDARFSNDASVGVSVVDEATLRKGQASWLAPFEVEDLGILIATYVAPVFVDGTYVGAIGMGVDFQVIIDQVANINVYETGYGFLTDAEGNVMYHPTIPFGTNLSEDDEDVPAVDAAIAAGTTVDDVVIYRYHGADKRMAFHLLQNDMRLVLSVDAREIYAGRDQFVARLIVVSALAAILFVAANLVFSSRELQPMADLTEAAERVADGDLSVSLPQSDVYEVSRLVAAYDRTVGELREQLSFIDALAHLDSLTGLFNKVAFDEAASELNARIAAGERPTFSIAMLDVNDLKEVNDEQGHETGDVLLRHAAEIMTDALSGYPLYRVGGDEFVALSEERLPELEGIAQDGVSIAYGVAFFDPASDTTVAEVLARADEAMYACKHAMKHKAERDA